MLAYGSILRAGDLVGVRGAGETYDGTYAIDEVTHVLQLGLFKQKFRLSREGIGAKTPLVKP